MGCSHAKGIRRYFHCSDRNITSQCHALAALQTGNCTSSLLSSAGLIPEFPDSVLRNTAWTVDARGQVRACESGDGDGVQRTDGEHARRAGALTALVPPDLYARAGSCPVSLLNDGKSGVARETSPSIVRVSGNWLLPYAIAGSVWRYEGRTARGRHPDRDRRRRPRARQDTVLR